MIKVFIIDDSAVVRTALTSLVEKEKDIQLIGTAQDPIFAMEKFQRQGWPDVIVLDIEMPRMDGLTFLKKIMATRPTPVIICSSIAPKGSRAAIEAMSLGAIEVIGKPEFQVKNFFEEAHEKFVYVIRAAAKAKPKAISAQATFRAKIEDKLTADAVLMSVAKPSAMLQGESYIAIGSSTGGVQTLEAIITKLPVSVPPILITQHMPGGFTTSFAERLDRISAVCVKEASHGDKLERGCVYIAPGELHMMVKRVASSLMIEIKNGPRVSRHKPSVDVLFRSCANEAPKSCTAFILTGMGDDGARGMKELHDRGARTYAQEEKSCIVYGMPKEAVAMGGVDKSLTPQQIVETIKSIR
ncbi:chemotaxis response regulator protein-glutamate methylesterase [Sulfuricurvum sp.]|uniref:protein-glutamate methylesterase/protein-glutamine glutaminase n=1 Tax=Sulfuricurvum sp. TaxID=2025608 RepID=UPI0019BAA40D|nr:chemotaxis response regulator protein-glutamate methylesterase [Sulfuricurvum sp.]MBD3806626.1 chemotaxis response regulator protein-glutamate methylesterase [Sulfuricurvum sp.]